MLGDVSIGETRRLPGRWPSTGQRSRSSSGWPGLRIREIASFSRSHPRSRHRRRTVVGEVENSGQVILSTPDRCARDGTARLGDVAADHPDTRVEADRWRDRLRTTLASRASTSNLGPGFDVLGLALAALRRSRRRTGRSALDQPLDGRGSSYLPADPRRISRRRSPPSCPRPRPRRNQRSTRRFRSGRGLRFLLLPSPARDRGRRRIAHDPFAVAGAESTGHAENARGIARSAASSRRRLVDGDAVRPTTAARRAHRSFVAVVLRSRARDRQPA